jgi:indolepyruvate ferredoxin oxidoreductase alpha subunit
MKSAVLLGDEAVAMGAVHAGLTASYAYPGTPSTEITEFLIPFSRKHGYPHVSWSTNEKTAYEEAMGVSFAGKRAMVSMKHVGLNVAADPFMNSAIVDINGGLVVAVADDPGMHSSQNEQDSRYYAEFARIVCLEPSDQQQAYEMTREAFDLSEKFQIPVLIRLVTRLAHSRAVVEMGERREENPIKKVARPASWTLLPVNARRQWKELLQVQKELLSFSEGSRFNKLTLNPENREVGVITTGIARNYYLENLEDLQSAPSHLHIGAYPIPGEKVRKLVAHVKTVLIFEEGYPFVERTLRGLVPPPVEIRGKESGEVPPDGELNPDIVRKALGLGERKGLEAPGVRLAGRPPQLCQGCPHADTYNAIKKALADYAPTMVTSDIGCYTLGALPPYSVIETCVCMGASVGLAKGAADAGFHPVLAVIGDSTFLHSGVTPLMDAAAANTNMTLLILDNEGVAMTGGQPTILPSSRLEPLILGLGVDPQHFHILDAHRKNTEKNAAVIRGEIEHRGLSVIVAARSCLELAKKRAKKE